MAGLVHPHQNKENLQIGKHKRGAFADESFSSKMKIVIGKLRNKAINHKKVENEHGLTLLIKFQEKYVTTLSQKIWISYEHISQIMKYHLWNKPMQSPKVYYGLCSAQLGPTKLALFPNKEHQSHCQIPTWFTNKHML